MTLDSPDVANYGDSTTTSAFLHGYEAGRRSRDDEFDALSLVADSWYFRANNPKSEWPEVKMINSIIDGREAKEERAAKFAQLDAIEKEKFDQVRALLDTGMTDEEVCTRVGVFVGIVRNIRAGVL